MDSNARKIILKTGVSFLLVFILFFSLGSVKLPLHFELKKSNTNAFFKTEKQKKNKKIKNSKFSRKAIQTSDIDSIVKKKQLVYNKTKSINNQVEIINSAPGIERVLLLGDSQLEGLKNPVNAYCMKNNHKLVASVIWYGSSTKNWALTDTLQYYINLYKPTTILFAIGLNELFVRDLENRTAYIKTIIQIFDKNNIKYSWIGPAAWTKDKGIISVMQTVVGNHFFPSHSILMERASDGRHPSKKAAKKWFDLVAENITSQGIIDFSTIVDTMPKLKSSRTILLKPMKTQ
jgi:hypothetical protein